MSRNLCVFLFFLVQLVQGQEYLSTSPEVTLADLQMTSHPEDSTANAFFLYENGFSRFDEGGEYNLLTDYEAKIKILNKKGFDQANFEIRLDKSSSDKELLRNLEAKTHYFENGMMRVKILTPDKIYTEENEEYDLVRFTFPSVTEGAVLSLSYQKESPFFFNFERWWFQSDIPKLYSRFVAEIPGNYRYHIKLIGTLKLDYDQDEIKRKCYYVRGVPEPADCVRSEYIMKNIPAFKEERYLTSKFNFISRLEYELNEIIRVDGTKNKFSRTWKDVDKELRTDNDLGRQLRKTQWVSEVLPQEIKALPNNRDKAVKIYDFVKAHYTWNGEYKIFRDMSIKDLLEEKSGNVSAINILLHNLYKEEGFKVLPVLSSTRSNGTPTQLHPVLTEFNYLLVQLDLDGQTVLLDATEKNAGFGLLPFRTLNKVGRLLDFENESSWIDLEPGSFSQVVVQDSLVLNDNGSITGSSAHSFSGYHALSVRNELAKQQEPDLFNAITHPNPQTQAISSLAQNIEELDKNVELRFDILNQPTLMNDQLFINPFSFKFFPENPFKLEERTYPIDFGYKDAYTYNIVLSIPEGHEIVELPESKILSLPENAGTLHYMVKKIDDRNVSFYCRITFPKSEYSAGYYPYFKVFMKELLHLQENTLLVVQKKSVKA